MMNLHFNVSTFHLCRSISAENEDIIRAAATSLGENGFINYFGLQVI